MTVEYIRYRITAEQQPAFLEAIRSANQLLSAAPDCLNYQLGHCEEDPTLFIWRIEWTSVERHLSGFRKSPEFGKFFQLVKPFYQSIQEMNHYAVVE
ncbi:antibiotic biosynthesis monooxygenase [Hymenobacter taeanensis]|uniref:Antibiotic biosynthesis monooxygenase n=1 Tax=Hymenobacter taeanensis TaxID=2735321 RepID=A0A6M6BHX4_9BACT|nr:MULTISPECIES: antibiotic biosynthesis monooxygenase family protein [Hymenobacter]QJX47629.1 antibiotic biosynthesis monooxygenase [Hymenobacter taeanensis]UOQ82888.1 antibiotic biosynthesis monooxygenase [Hymenobacter sp. 5414T-23]